MNIFVTGGSGFIGKNLIEFFGSKYTVIAPSHKELELLDERAVKDYLQAHKPDVIIHSAVRPGHRNAKDPSNQLYNNLRMFFNIIRNGKCFGKMIFLSSGAVYDASKPLIKVNEDFFDTSIPSDEHGFSKYVIAKHIEKLNNIVELRLFGIFGKYEDYSIRFISNAICKSIFALPITIKQDRRLDYIYIDDLMPVLDYFIKNNGAFKTYNVTPDESIELSELAGKVKKACNNDLALIIKEKSMGVEYSGDNSRLRKEIKGLKFTAIDLSIKKLADWYKANKPLINRESLLIDK